MCELSQSARTLWPGASVSSSAQNAATCRPVECVGLEQDRYVARRGRHPVQRADLARARAFRRTGVGVVTREDPDAERTEIGRELQVRLERLLLDRAQPHVAADREDLQAGVLDPAAQLPPLGRRQAGVGELVRRRAQLQTGEVVALGKCQDVVECCSGTTEGGET
ncbi:hypothetical protein ACXJJ3_22175 [Kribbella sp. WER1]